MRNSYDIERTHIEHYLLSMFLNQNRSLPMDEMEIRDTKIPFELFKASRLTKMIAKAIHNFQEEEKPVDDELILCYIQKHATINIQEWFEISCTAHGSFDSMKYYLNMLKQIDKDEELEKKLKGLR